MPKTLQWEIDDLKERRKWHKVDQTRTEGCKRKAAQQRLLPPEIWLRIEDCWHQRIDPWTPKESQTAGAGSTDRANTADASLSSPPPPSCHTDWRSRSGQSDNRLVPTRNYAPGRAKPLSKKWQPFEHKSPYTDGRSSWYGPLLPISDYGDYFYSIFLFFLSMMSLNYSPSVLFQTAVLDIPVL